MPQNKLTPPVPTIKEFRQYLKQFSQDIPLAVVYSLNDWPGDSWDNLKLDANILRPYDLTNTGAADPNAKILSLVFDVRK